jgi:hypothetical protein
MQFIMNPKTRENPLTGADNHFCYIINEMGDRYFRNKDIRWKKIYFSAKLQLPLFYKI